MLFTSIVYLAFLAVVVLAYWLAPTRFRRVLLLVASYVFYMSWIAGYGLLIFGMTVGNYFLGLGIASSSAARRKLLLVVALVLNLGLLAFFKYAGFLVGSLNHLASPLGFAVESSWAARIILPIGISFFAFEFIHYVVDVYRGSAPIRSFVDLALFPAFFPTQIAGPIKRYQQFVPQLDDLPCWDATYFQVGLGLIVRGLFKKMVLADSLAVTANMGFAGSGRLGFVDAWVAVIAFAFQIYFDFSGYTDIGRGSAMLLGFKVPENFDLPYLAKNIAEFWRRWHITLSQWLRDYLFIPLGGSRGTRLETYRNLFITMTLGGLWHGASWTFVIWGMYQGILLIGHREFQRRFGGRLTRSTGGSGSAMQVISTLITFLFVCFGWVFFRARTMPQAFDIIRSMLGLGGTIYASTIIETRLLETALITVGWLVFVLCVKWFALPQNQTRLADNRWVLQAVYYAAMLVGVIALRPAASAAFIYFQF